jgi:serine-type D-Ala-D-Ala endopeptidase (penicillin-binding protein 7)
MLFGTMVHRIGILSLLALAPLGVQATPQKSAASPQLRSNVALVFDETTSAVLYSKNADSVAPIASITKLMTALVVLEAGQPLDEVLTVESPDRSNTKGAASRLAIGTRLSRRELLHLALMSSENRAAHALGRNYPGGLGACVQAMNAKAKALGMRHARFYDPTGLDEGNVASPRDLSTLVIAASRNPTISALSTDDRFSVKVGRSMLEFRNTNNLVNKPAWNIVVQKTGYISEAGKCLVMKAIINEHSIVIVLLDSYGKYTRTADANRVRKWLEGAGTKGGLPT